MSKSENQEKKFKELLPALLLSFATSFMLFVYEPLALYFNNKDEFWFDFYLLFFLSVCLCLRLPF